MLLISCLLATSSGSLGSAPAQTRAPDPPALQDEPVLVELRAAMGQSWRYLVRHETSMLQDMGTVNFRTTLEYEQEVVLEAAAAQESRERAFTIRFGHVAGALEMTPLGRVPFDTRDPALSLPPLVEPILGVVMLTAGRELSARVDPRGRLLELGGFAAIYADSAVEGFFTLSGGSLDDTSQQTHFQYCFPLLPAGPIARGSRWNLSLPHAPMERAMSFEVECFVGKSGAERVGWTFVWAGRPDPDPRTPAAGNAPPGSSATATRFLEIQDLVLAGSCTVAREDGLIVHQVLDVELSLLQQNPFGHAPIPAVMTERVEIVRR